MRLVASAVACLGSNAEPGRLEHVARARTGHPWTLKWGTLRPKVQPWCLAAGGVTRLESTGALPRITPHASSASTHDLRPSLPPTDFGSRSPVACRHFTITKM